MEGDLSEGNLSKTGLQIPEHDHRKHYPFQCEWVNHTLGTVRFARRMLCVGLIYRIRWSVRLKYPDWEESSGCAHADEHSNIHRKTHMPSLRQTVSIYSGHAHTLICIFRSGSNVERFNAALSFHDFAFWTCHETKQEARFWSVIAHEVNANGCDQMTWALQE